MAGKKSPPGYPKRPKHGYNFFLSKRTKELRAERDAILARGDTLPHDHPLAQPGLITKHLGEEWQQIKYVPHLVAPYERMAEDAQRQYFLINLPRWRHQTANNQDSAEAALTGNGNAVAASSGTSDISTSPCCKRAIIPNKASVKRKRHHDQQQLTNSQDDRKPAAVKDDFPPIDVMIIDRSTKDNPSEDIIQWASEQTKQSKASTRNNIAPAAKRMKRSVSLPLRPAVRNIIHQSRSIHSDGEDTTFREAFSSPDGRQKSYPDDDDEDECLQMLKHDSFLMERLLSLDSSSPDSDNNNVATTRADFSLPSNLDDKYQATSHLYPTTSMFPAVMSQHDQLFGTHYHQIRSFDQQNQSIDSFYSTDDNDKIDDEHKS